MPMTGTDYLLDTNIISALFKGEEIISSKIVDATNINIPVIALGELYYGIELSNTLKYMADIEDIKATYELLVVDDITSKYYGTVKAALRKKGTPIPENDIWIAALALQHNLTLATRDKHFDEVDGLMTEKW